MNKPLCFKVKYGKTHRLVEDVVKDRFPLGRAKCAPFSRHLQDKLMEPNEVPQADFCKLCL